MNELKYLTLKFVILNVSHRHKPFHTQLMATQILNRFQEDYTTFHFVHYFITEKNMDGLIVEQHFHIKYKVITRTAVTFRISTELFIWYET